jgi:hypothetical protein
MSRQIRSTNLTFDQLQEIEKMEVFFNESAGSLTTICGAFRDYWISQQISKEQIRLRSKFADDYLNNISANKFDQRSLAELCLYVDIQAAKLQGSQKVRLDPQVFQKEFYLQTKKSPVSSQQIEESFLKLIDKLALLYQTVFSLEEAPSRRSMQNSIWRPYLADGFNGADLAERLKETFSSDYAIMLPGKPSGVIESTYLIQLQSLSVEILCAAVCQDKTRPFMAESLQDQLLLSSNSGPARNAFTNQVAWPALHASVWVQAQAHRSFIDQLFVRHGDVYPEVAFLETWGDELVLAAYRLSRMPMPECL